MRAQRAEISFGGISYLHLTITRYSIFLEWVIVNLALEMQKTAIIYLYATGGLIKSCIYAFLFGKVFHSISKLKQQNVALADFCFSAAIAYLVLGLFETNLLLELGLVNFVYALYALFIPTMYNLVERPINSMAQCR